MNRYNARRVSQKARDKMLLGAFDLIDSTRKPWRQSLMDVVRLVSDATGETVTRIEEAMVRDGRLAQDRLKEAQQ